MNPVEPALHGSTASVHSFAVAPGRAGERLDRFLAAETAAAGADLSRTRLKTLIEGGHVSVNGVIVTEASFAVRAGQALAVAVPPAAEPIPAGEAIALDIRFEDEHLLVLDKPAGLVVHPGAGHESGTLVNALIAHCGDSLSGIGGVKRPGIVHRLDKDTSGLMVVAKTDRAHQGLARLFADHGRTLPLLREYLAFVWGAPDRASGLVDAPLGRHPVDREKIAIVAAARGRRAVTHWRLLEQLGPEVAALACRLETGRTHQIRVHMASLGWPLLGDPVYGRGFKTKAGRLPPEAQAALIALGRQALHARALGFEHPVTGAALAFESDPPPDMAELQAALRRSA
ncbi:pseudouridine synthase, RluA family [Methylocella silvestris BL2]|uniref:Pseudouridine synthase n=1 Tax=Methylocella silvestris (strain DSM 15510 / CIP 108128 / LMG 27833 / NCIMB 13906 / BL2) TaxID=395965 RepID=B8EIC0_METSB|nr:RluA family pseudouridine synthase [Methylocella silvestris]ACK51239.1 pseudouridine synthase, RluA family [Methylocella silvestris BL2]